MNETPETRVSPLAMRKSRENFPLWQKITVPLLLLLVGAMGGFYLMQQKPQAKKKEKTEHAPLVSVVTVHRETAQEMLSAMGTVRAEKRVVMKSRVSGEVVRVADDFIPGGRFQKGAEILRMDPADYEIALRKAKAAHETALADQELEAGRGAMAKAETEALRGGEDPLLTVSDLTLRMPQKRRAEAVVAAAKADLRKANLDLGRTRIAAPFDGVLTERAVNIGSRVMPGESLVTLVGTDRFWIEARLPAEDLAHLPSPDTEGDGGRVRVLVPGGERWGRVKRVLPDLADATRMARILVVVEDPLGLKTDAAPLFLGGYVNLMLSGRTVHDVLRIPDTALREDDGIWVVENKRLRFVTAQVIFEADREVVVRADIADGAFVVVSDPGIVADGMKVRVAEGDGA